MYVDDKLLVVVVLVCIGFLVGRYVLAPVAAWFDGGPTIILGRER